jgi:signal recognition particle receptor subunit beta
VVYVADSQLNRLKANIDTMRSLDENLRALGLNPLDFPLVLQYNKRDLPSIAPIALLRMQLARDGVPQFQSVATEGVGVVETLKAAINLVISRM